MAAMQDTRALARSARGPYRASPAALARRAGARERLLAAAAAIIADRGYAGLTIAGAAARAGVSVGSVYRHFESKAELAAEVFRREAGRELEAVRLAARVGGGPLAALRAAVGTFAGRALAGPRLAWALLAEPVGPEVGAERLRFRGQYRELFAGLIGRAMAAGEIPAGQDPWLTAAAVVGTVAESLIGPLAPGRGEPGSRCRGPASGGRRREAGRRPRPAGRRGSRRRSAPRRAHHPAGGPPLRRPALIREVPMFLQEPPRPGNRMTSDPALLGALERLLSEQALAEVRQDLTEFAARVAGEFGPLQAAAEAQPPRHVPYDAWGRRIDRIDVSPAWLELVREGLVAAAYERPGPDGRVLQAALIQLFQPASAMATCPMAMTDGAARVLLAHDRDLAAAHVPRLAGRSGAWTSGQWMTETPGGSDVSRTEVTARPSADGAWTLHGTKWFTSATTADIALVLARPEGRAGDESGLSLFLAELRRPDGSWNGIGVRRLKDKLGTRALPTAELDLDGTTAVPVGGLGRGVAKVASMLNVTRLWASHGAVGPAGHLLALARDYASRREAFGRRLRDLPIHTHWLSELAATYEAAVALSFQAAWIVGAAESGQGDPLLARIVTPLTKLACARQGLTVASELLESFGGAGYLEDTGIPVIFRDVHAQVIWEGTSSVMAHDVLRALGKAGAREAFHDDLDRRVARAGHPALAATAARVAKAAARLRDLTAAAGEATARPLAWSMARTYQAALLCEAASQRPADTRLASAARVFCRQPLVTDDGDPGSLAELAYGG